MPLNLNCNKDDEPTTGEVICDCLTELGEGICTCIEAQTDTLIECLEDIKLLLGNLETKDFEIARWCALDADGEKLADILLQYEYDEDTGALVGTTPLNPDGSAYSGPAYDTIGLCPSNEATECCYGPSSQTV